MSESFAELFEQSVTGKVMTPGAVTTAEVVDILGDMVIVSAGLKSEAEIPAIQFLGADGSLAIKIGDQVEVAIETLEDGYGTTRLSHEKAARARSWDRLEKAFEGQALVKGVLTGKVKGGFTVIMDGLRAFLPGSLVDVRPVKDATHLEGKELEFKIIKLDRKRNNIVLSRRAVLETTMDAEREALLANLQEGQIVRGMVKNLTDYGAFVNLGGIDGLLHITDISWQRVRHPSEVLKVGDEVEARVLKFDRERNRVSLGMKQLAEDPWVDLARRHPVGSRCFGKVSNLAEYGAFVEIEAGVEGLVHVSEMDWTNKNVHPSKVVRIGDEVEVKVLDIDEERRRISLGIKQCKPNPWEEFAKNHNKGDRVRGAIKSITDFGVFIGLDGGIDGLIHLSDLSWSATGEEAVREYGKGQELEAVVLAVDPERERISLGIKQISADPFTAFVNAHGKGSAVKGTVGEVDAKGATIALGDGVEGYLRVSEIAREHTDDARNALKPGDEIAAKVTSIDRKTRRISLSIKALEMDQESEVVQEYTRKSGATATLAEKLKEQLEKRGE